MTLTDKQRAILERALAGTTVQGDFSQPAFFELQNQSMAIHDYDSEGNDVIIVTPAGRKALEEK